MRWPFGKTHFEVPPRAFLGVRMEAIGGQGANSAGKILAETAVLGQGFTGNHFSSFGSEKRGTPVRSFVRISFEKREVRSATTIVHPDLLVVFHENLLQSHPEILAGSSFDTDLLVNTEKDPRDLVFPEGTRFRRLATVRGTELARKYECGLNIPLLGALVELCPEIDAKLLAQTMLRFFQKKADLEGIAKAYQKGRDAVEIRLFRDIQSRLQFSQEPPLPQLGWANAPIGGVIINPGNSVLKDNSASRKGTAPRFISDLCFHCGRCDMVCPDFCFVWDTSASPPRLQGLDYQYCKSCQKCVSVCPVEALVLTPESEIPEQERSLHAFPPRK